MAPGKEAIQKIAEDRMPDLVFGEQGRVERRSPFHPPLDGTGPLQSSKHGCQRRVGAIGQRLLNLRHRRLATAPEDAEDFVLQLTGRPSHASLSRFPPL